MENVWNASAFAARLKEARKKAGKTQDEVAAALSIKRPSYATYENGIVKPPIDKLKAIAELFNVSLDWLCGLTDFQTTNGHTETYSDILRFLLSIQYGNSDMYDKQHNTHKIKAIKLNEDTFESSIIFFDYNLFDMLEEWKTVSPVFEKEKSGDILYRLWIKDALERYGKEITWDRPG